VDKWAAEGGAKEPQAQVSTAATPALSGEGCDGTLQRGCSEQSCINQGGTAGRKPALVQGQAFLVLAGSLRLYLSADN